MATIFNNISPDGENRRLMLIDAWAEDPITVDMMDHPVNGDKVAVRSHNSLNEIVVDSVKVYDNGSWVDEGGGGGGIENAIVETDSATWTEDGGLYVAGFPLDPIIDPLAIPASLGVIYGNNAYVLPAAGSTPPDDSKFGTWTGGTPSFSTYPIAIVLSDDEEQFDTLSIAAEDGSVTKITVFA